MGLSQGWRDLDRILRGEATRLPALRRGRVEAALGGLLLALLVGGRYPGEQTLRRFMQPRRVPRRRASITARPPRRLVLARRACLLAEHLATRPPPRTGLAGAL